MKINAVFKKYCFIVLQALCAVLISACICIYSFCSIMKVRYTNDEYTTRVSISEFRTDYYDSAIYKTNIQNAIDNAVKYAVIKSQLETDGKYDPDKIVYIGKYANRYNTEEYDGVDAGYYLKDLIAWGQYGISQNGISHSYRTFDSFEEMENFFGRNGEPYRKDEATESEITSEIPMLDVIGNGYLSIDNKNLEYYAYNADDYNILASNLSSSAIDLYTNYRFYADLKEFFDADNSNIRFYLNDGKGNVYTNLLNYKVLDETKLSETFKGMGEYVYCMPGKLDFLTNTPVQYDFVKEIMLYYSYALDDDAFFWMGLDTTYPVRDLFSDNYNGLKRTIHMIPWVISLAAIGLFGFIGLLVLLIIEERKRFAIEDPASELKLADRLPLEIEALLYALLFVVVNVSAIFIMRDNSVTTAARLRNILLPECIVTFMYSVTTLLLFYSVVRRILAHEFLSESYIYRFFAWFFGKFSFVTRWGTRIYNSSGIALRTWGSYLFFIVFNTFWACMLFFSSIPVVAFVVLLVFDGITGIILFNRNWEKKRIIDAISMINEGNYDVKLDLNKYHGGNKELAETVNEVGKSIKQAVETSSKDEKLKADLITNVSHDIKTPLTSIINYVDLIKRENIDNERVNNYIRILDDKSQRLKQLTVDLVEASKITSGNVNLEFTKINLLELLNQAKGEFEEKYASRNLTLIETVPSGAVMMDADPRYLWRIVENLLQNIYKYAMEGTRVYLDVTIDEETNCVSMLFKNISKQQLNIEASELTERFIRGDLARSTEGSGLGLSIVKSLVKAHNGSFNVYLDGDLFKATVTLPLLSEEEKNNSAE